MDWDKRVEKTVSCRDCDYIPKVHNAGEIIKHKGVDCQVMHNGVVVFKDGYFGEGNTRIVSELKGHHEPQEEKLFHEVLKLVEPNSTMIELGAYWAYYSIWFNKAIEGAINYAIEPEQTALQVGLVNLKLNDCRFGIERAMTGRQVSQSLLHGVHDSRNARDILPVVSVDHLVNRHEIESLAILHSDIQGCEVEMLLGASSSLRARKIDYLFVSTHSADIHYMCLKYLERVGYEIIVEHDMSQAFAVDGLILAAGPGVPTPADVSISFAS